MAGNKRDGASSAVNWNIVDDELQRIAPDFKDPKFYALKHVVEILSSNTPQVMVAEVRLSAAVALHHVSPLQI
jgi:hypothetical protein